MRIAAAPSNFQKVTDWLWIVALLPLPVIAVGQFVGFFLFR
jgi:hypothetical protein